MPRRMFRGTFEETLPDWLVGKRVKDVPELPKSLFSDNEDKALGPNL